MAEPTGQSELDVGTVVAGTYQVTGLIGRGGMGAVWVAQHMRLPGKRVAVKVLLNSNVGDEAYARFRREADIASRLGHPNIVEVVDFNTLPSGTPYLVLEFLQGESLATRMTRGPVPLDNMFSIVRQIGSALAAAHRAGVVHRDLKPDNIFLTPTDVGGVVSEHVKVLDFGISKIRSSNTVQTQEARILGTPQYMSPEQAAGKNSSIDQRTDVFALGAIVYEMLTGRPAFAGDNLAMVVFRVVYEEPDPIEAFVQGVPPNVLAAIKKALAKKPDERYPDVMSFVAELSGRPLHTIDRMSAQGAPQQPSPSLGYAPTAAPPGASLGMAQTAAAPGSVTPAGVFHEAQQAPPGVLPVGTMPGQLPAGTVQQAAPPVEPAKKKSKAWLWALLLLFVVVGGGAAAVIATRGGGQTVAGEPKPEPETGDRKPEAGDRKPEAGDRKPDPVAVVVPMPPDAAPVASAPPDAAPVASAPPDAAVVVKKPVDKKPVDKKPDPPPPPEEPEEPASDGPLDEARDALKAGDYGEAVRKAERAMASMARKGPAYAVITMGYCGKKDLSNARANWQNVPPIRKPTVRGFCRKHGIDL